MPEKSRQPSAEAGNGQTGDSAALSRRANQSSSAPAEALEVVVHKALADFSTTFNGVSVSFKMGQLIAEPTVIADLKRRSCPIGPTNDAVAHRCPKCGTISPIELKPGEFLRRVA